jgi:hypothetical protein
MAATPMISAAAAVAGLNAILATLNTGGAGQIKVWTGSLPASCETADSGTELVACPLSSTAFASATDSGSGSATASANAITTGTASSSGTAGYFRGYNGNGVCVIQGTVGTSLADMILSTTAINEDDLVPIASWVVNLPDGSGID